MQLKNNDVLFCYRDTILSESIRFVDIAEYSHVAIVRIIDGETFIADAQIDGIKLRPYEEWMNKFDYSFTIIRSSRMSERVEKKISQKVMLHLGKKYDKIGLLMQFWLQIHEMFFRKDASIRTDNEKLYSSEFVASVFNVKYVDISPQRLYRVFKKREYLEFN